MFKSGDDVLFVAEGGVALKSLDGGNIYARNQERIFIISFLDVILTGISSDIDNWRERLMSAA